MFANYKIFRLILAECNQKVFHVSINAIIKTIYSFLKNIGCTYLNYSLYDLVYNEEFYNTS